MTNAPSATGIRTARLLIADDNQFARLGLELTVSECPDLVIVGQATDGTEAVSLCDTLRPDVVVLDLRMPVLDGIAATRAIKASYPETLVLVVSAEDMPGYRQQATEAGADGFIPKDELPEELVPEVRRLIRQRDTGAS